jgi:hypothetical protein
MKIINRNVCLVLLLLVSQITVAQQVKKDSSKTEYIFKGIGAQRITQLGLYIAPETQVSSLGGKFSPLTGGSVMLLLNQRLGIGVSGYTSLRNRHKSNDIDTRYGGVRVEYTFNPNKRFHISVPILIGMGMANNDSTNRYGGGPRRGWYDNGRNRFDGSNYFVVQPGVNIEGNLFRYAKIFVGASYRFANITHERHNSSTDLSSSQLSGVSFNIGLKLGLFDYSIRKKKD